MAPERLTGLDAAFIAAESPANLMHMMAIMLLDPSSVPGGYRFEKFRDFIATRVASLPPLHRRLVEVPFGLARPVWVDVESIDIDLHLRRIAVPSPGGPRELAELAAHMNGEALDRSLPLWEMAVVEGLQDGSIALLAKIHHALMDGMSGMQHMVSLVGRTPAIPDLAESEAGDGEPVPGQLEMLVRALPGIVARPFQLTRLAGRTLLAGVANRFTRSPRPLALPEAAPISRTIFNHPITHRRSVAYTALPIVGVKRIAETFDVTLNDVVVTLVAGTIREYLIAHDQPVDTPLVVAVPVSTHAAGGDDQTNAYSVIFPSLATHIADPVERLSAIHDSCAVEKQRQGPLRGASLGEWTALPSPLLLRWIAHAYADLGLAEYLSPLCNLVVSNVPGPPITLYFGGARIRGIYPLGPIFDGVGLNITVMSIEDTLDIGVSACREIVPDPWRIADGLPMALSELSDRLHGQALPA